MSTRYDDLTAALGSGTVSTIAATKVLLVGVGGIGALCVRTGPAVLPSAVRDASSLFFVWQAARC
jgi:hypothetical protein